MRVAVAILPNGMVNAHFGRANKLGVATIEDKKVVSWEELEVPFAKTHGDHGHHHDHDHNHDHDHHHDHNHGGGHHHHPDHHKNIKNFLVDNKIDMVLLDHAGPAIKAVQQDTEIKIVVGAQGDAKEAIQALIDQGFVE